MEQENIALGIFTTDRLLFIVSLIVSKSLGSDNVDSPPINLKYIGFSHKILIPLSI